MDESIKLMEMYNDVDHWIPVIYNGQPGNLVLSPVHLCFIGTNGSISINWAWKSLRKATAINNILTIHHHKRSNEPLHFQFETQEALLAAANDFRDHMAMAHNDSRSSVTSYASFANAELPHMPQPQEQAPMTNHDSRSSLNKTKEKPLSNKEQPTDGRAQEKMNHKRQSHVGREAEYVTLPRSELDGMVKREEVEALQKMVQQERHEREELAEMVRSLLRVQNNPQGDPPKLETNAPAPQEDEIELTRLVGSDGEHPPSAVAASEDDFKEEYQDQEDDDVNWHTPFGETVYTLMYMCKVQSQGFFYSVFVYGLQIATISLALIDIVDRKSEENPLQIPAMVDPTVTWAQGITILLFLAYQSDLIEAFLKLQDGYYPEILEDHSGATFTTWITSCLAQLMAGMLVLFTSFILTMQASTVIELMLNLTALLFIAEIDNLGFYLCKMGFITDKLQIESQSVVGIRVPKHKTRGRYRKALFFATLISLFTAYGIIKMQQLGGHYLPTYIYVQFGDAYNPKIPFFSGILTSGDIRTPSHRRYRDLGTENLLLTYCPSERAWTFSDTGDPCDFFAKSLETTTYDVTSIADSEWYVLDSIKRLQPFDSFSLVSRDCDPKTCQGNCTADGLCQCDHDHFGMDCEFSDVCPELHIDERLQPFPPLFVDLDLYQVSPEFHLLQNPRTKEYVRTYNMPVYYSNKTFPANIIFFGGRRWIITSERGMINLSQAFEENPGSWFFPEKTISRFEEAFHAYHQATYSPIFISDPVDFETPDFQATPLGLNWWRVKETNETLRHFAPDIPIETVFLCQEPQASCLGKPTDFCVHGFCNNETGFCECDWTFVGDTCEVQEKCYDALQPCGETRGVCDQDTGYCRCNLPWSGKLCLYPYWCVEEGGHCQNGGVCDEVFGSCSCPLDPAITGPACEKRAHCMYFGCANGGICSQNGQCVCRPPFQGAQCDLVDTTKEEFFCAGDEDCVNGRCNTDTGVCECDDPSSYGTLCEHQYNCSNIHSEIAINPPPGCQNSGTCNPSTGVCSCPEPYFGPDCSKLPPCVNNTDCAGLYCDVDSGLCLCTLNSPWEEDRGFLGKRCERGPKWWCREDADCYGSSTCGESGYCLCGSEFAGQFCDSLVGGMYNPDYDQNLVELTYNIGRCGFEDPSCSRCQEADPPSYC